MLGFKSTADNTAAYISGSDCRLSAQVVSFQVTLKFNKCWTSTMQKKSKLMGQAIKKKWNCEHLYKNLSWQSPSQNYIQHIHPHSFSRSASTQPSQHRQEDNLRLLMLTASNRHINPQNPTTWVFRMRFGKVTLSSLDLSTEALCFCCLVLTRSKLSVKSWLAACWCTSRKRTPEHVPWALVQGRGETE